MLRQGGRVTIAARLALAYGRMGSNFYSAAVPGRGQLLPKKCFWRGVDPSPHEMTNCNLGRKR